MGSTLGGPILARVGPAVLALGLFGAATATGAVAAPIGTAAFCDSPPSVETPVVGNAARAFEGDARPGTRARWLSATDLTCRTPAEIRALATRHGFSGYGRPDVAGHYRKFREPYTDLERLRLDAGHVDRVTGRPYSDPRAAIPHVHGYDPSGEPIRDPATGNTHFPFRSR